MMNKEVLFVFLLLAFPMLVKAGERYEFYNGARQLGMGGATIAVVNDETALITNPAALGKLRSKFVTVVDPELHTGEHTAQIIKEKDYNLMKTFDPQDLLEVLRANPDKPYHLKLNLFPSIVLPNFGFGVLANYNYDAEVLSASNEFHLRYRNDISVLLGYNFRFFDGRVKLGFNLRYTNRAEMDDLFPDSSSGLDFKNLVNEGTAVGSDIGLILTAPWQYLPTLAAVVRDVGDTSYTLGSGMLYSGRPLPEKTKQTIDVGASISPILGKNSRWQLAAEFRDITTDDDDEVAKRRLHYGMELNFYDKLFMRGGLNQGYWTAGFEIASQVLQFQVATYGEEIGTKDATREDRRYVFKFSMRF